MREPKVWLAAAIYDTTRQALPTLCSDMGCRPVYWAHWDHVPTKVQQMFIEFAEGILTGVKEYLKEGQGNAATESETQRE